MGFVQTTNSDPCLYIASEGEMFIIAVIFVDGIRLAGMNDERMEQVKSLSPISLKCIDMRELQYFWVVNVISGP